MTSTAASAQYRNVCLVCHAPGLSPCRTLKTRRVTDTHKARIDAAYSTPNVMPRRIRKAPVADKPIKIMRYFPTEPVITESDVDMLSILRYGRTKSMNLLREKS